jgi:hypothetical protein
MDDALAYFEKDFKMPGSIKINFTYAQAKSIADFRDREYRAASDKINAVNGIGSGSMGLTPDHVRATSEYKRAKADLDTAFSNLRTANSFLVKNFKKELRAERASKIEEMPK